MKCPAPSFLPDQQIERAEAGDDVEVAVVIDVVGDDADELIAGRAIDGRGEPVRQRDRRDRRPAPA